MRLRQSNQGGIESCAAALARTPQAMPQSNQGGIERDYRAEALAPQLGRRNRTKVGLKDGSMQHLGDFPVRPQSNQGGIERIM